MDAIIEKKYKFSILTSNNGSLNIPLIEGQALFVLGANGVGKSTLMYNLFLQNKNHSKRILAHRQTWFDDNSMNMTASQKKQNEEWIKGHDSNTYSRWKDEFTQKRSSISIFDLINSENIRARRIANAVDTDKIELAKKYSNFQAPLQAINELLAISNIPITITLGREEHLFASKNGCEPYSIAELSDGERNALLICADVLTTEPNRLIIIDEPERHLHRSIISPLLTSLFHKRRDCVFVISTHDVFLPVDHYESQVLLLRSCNWNGKNIKDWDADLISDTAKIPDSVKLDILGAKRNILFVEGEYESLDRQIYQLIFPNVTVIPQGSCNKVEKAVEGIKGTVELHWINAYGLIDSDDRTRDQIQTLHSKGIAALKSYSVESLYYNLDIVKKVAKRLSEVTGMDENELYAKATSEIINNLRPHKERLCSRLCEKQVRNKVMTILPKHKDIAQKRIFQYALDLKEVIEKEEALFEKLIAENNLNGLISRYPIRETPVLTKIATGLGLTRDKYECAVRKLIIDDKETKEFYKTLLAPLTDLIENKNYAPPR
ncbi:AAA family ATPase [Paludibacter sp.]|uniref:AAA family ATPase n=1 Tax=Paludibacter sp. TaxID=1898105 RepID=UPI0013529770|nr:AAA family ATPase [Paludibacter sp.]MTK53623.1 AAA family ATPase [Paludibacter sp.]